MSNWENYTFEVKHNKYRIKLWSMTICIYCFIDCFANQGLVDTLFLAFRRYFSITFLLLRSILGFWKVVSSYRYKLVAKKYLLFKMHPFNCCMILTIFLYFIEQLNLCFSESLLRKKFSLKVKLLILSIYFFYSMLLTFLSILWLRRCVLLVNKVV